MDAIPSDIEWPPPIVERSCSNVLNEALWHAEMVAQLHTNDTFTAAAAREETHNRLTASMWLHAKQPPQKLARKGAAEFRAAKAQLASVDQLRAAYRPNLPFQPTVVRRQLRKGQRNTGDQRHVEKTSVALS